MNRLDVVVDVGLLDKGLVARRAGVRPLASVDEGVLFQRRRRDALEPADVAHVGRVQALTMRSVR